MKQMDTKELGDFGERVARNYLVKNGFEILEKNYRVPFGEIDIIARKKWKFFKHDKTIHFVEVKTLFANSNFFPEQKFDQKKRFKIASLCQLWLQKTKLPLNWPHQIDVVAVTVDPNSKNSQIHYIANAVSEKN